MCKKILFLMLAFITFLCLMIGGHYIFKPEGISKVNVLNDGWNVRYNGREFTDIKLSDLRELIGDAPKSGDYIVLSRYISSLKYHTAPTLMFESRFSAWRFSYNDFVFSENHYDDLKYNSFIGCENNFISLPARDTSALIKIELAVTEDGAYNFFDPVLYGSYRDVLLYVIYNNLFVLISSVFLFVFGAVFFFIALGFKSTIIETNTQIFSSLLYVTLAIWFLSQFNLLDMFIDTNEHQTEIEYISLFLTVPLMYMVIGCAHNYVANKLFRLFSTVGTLVALLPIVLHIINVGHINQYLIIFQIDALTMCAFMMVLLIIDIKTNSISHPQIVQLIGLTVLALSFIFNVIFFYIELSGIYQQIMLSKKAVPMGALCMVFATLVNYYVYISESYAKKKENESLTHLAYADGLTNLPNRSKYEKFLNDLNESGMDYCIVSLDLNGLKAVNDNQGHLMGDKYLTDFSKALNESFGGSAFIARIGGDEFVAVLKDKEIMSADVLIKKLNRMLDNMNKKDPSISRSCACGYAYRHEASDNGWNSAYLLADKRMYGKKAQMK